MTTSSNLLNPIQCIPHLTAAPSGFRRVLKCCKCATFGPPHPYTFPLHQTRNRRHDIPGSCLFCHHTLCVDYCSPCIYSLYWCCWSCGDQNLFDIREVAGARCRTCDYPLDGACLGMFWYWSGGGYGVGEAPPEEEDPEFPVLGTTWEEEEDRMKKVNQWIVEGRVGGAMGEMREGVKICVDLMAPMEEVRKNNIQSPSAEMIFPMAPVGFVPVGGWRIVDNGPLDEWESLVGQRNVALGW